MTTDLVRLDRAFKPRSIAVVGDKRELRFMWLRAQSAFKGRLYSVQIDPEEIEGIRALGVPNYTSLSDIPEPVDLVIVSVPREVTPAILEDCINKGVAAAHFFTSGFSETGTEEGKELEQWLRTRAKEAGFYLIGPNCMGIFNPALGLRQVEEQYTGFAGSVGFISQSGTHAVNFSVEGHLQGIDVNKSVSFGNGIVLEAADYLDYFGRDSDIKIIGMYLEGVKEGRRLFNVLKEISALKPVVIWKGGRTEAGHRAIDSHTGALAVPLSIWNTSVKQAGAISVTNLEELIDTLKALLYLSPVRGGRVGLAGGSGGQSVAITDAFAEAGLKVPLLTPKSNKELATFFNLVGASCRNPIDPGPNRKQLGHIMEIMERDDNIDNLALLMWPMAQARNPKQIESDIELLTNIRKKTTKPVMAILPSLSSSEDCQRVRNIAQKLLDGDVPAFPTAERGARALKNALEYYTLKDPGAGAKG